MCKSTPGTLIYCQTAGDITDPGYMVIPVHGIAALRFGHPTPVLNLVKRAVIKRLLSEVGGFQHN